jgi:raffinose/stachyose/melibiose transport system permease protein
MSMTLRRGGAKSRRSVVPHGVLIIWAVVILVPLLFIVYLSFKTFAGIVAHPLQLPTHPQWSNYSQAWTNGDLLVLLVNTVVIAASAVVIILAVSSLAAFALARFKFFGNHALYLFFLAGLALPIQIVALPLFILMRQLDLLNNLLSLVLIYASGGISFSVFLLANFMRTIPKELEEAAYIDGSSALQVYWHVVLPLVRPVMSVVAVFNFLTAWTGFFFPLLLINNKSSMPVAVGILSFVGQHETEWNVLLPALIIVSLPTIIAFIFVSRQFRRNMLAGAVKM